MSIITKFLIACFPIIFVFALPLMITEIVFSLPILFMLILTLIVSLKLTGIMLNFNGRILELTFYCFVYIFLTIAPLMQIIQNKFPMSGDLYNETEIISGIIIILLGLIGYEIGIKMKVKKKEYINIVLTLKNIYLIFFISLFLMFIAIQGLGGFNSVINNTRVPMDQSMSLIYNSLLRVPIYIVLLFVLLKRKEIKKREGNITWHYNLLLVVLLLLNFVASNPFYTSRYWYGTVLISIVIITFGWNKNSAPLYIYSLLLGFLLIFPYADTARSPESLSINFSDISKNLTTGDFDAFQAIMNSNRFIELEGITFGKQLLGAFLFFVPRSIWATKPIGTGATMGIYFNYINTNISAPLWAEFNVDFSIIGVFLLFLIYGRITNELQKGYARTLGTMSFYQIFIPFFAFYQFFLLRGDLLTSTANLIPAVLFIWLGTKSSVFQKKV